MSSRWDRSLLPSEQARKTAHKAVFLTMFSLVVKIVLADPPPKDNESDGGGVFVQLLTYIAESLLYEDFMRVRSWPKC